MKKRRTKLEVKKGKNSIAVFEKVNKGTLNKVGKKAIKGGSIISDDDGI